MLEILDAEGALERAVLLDAAAGQRREGVDLVRRHVDYLGHLAGRPPVAPHVAAHREGVVVLVDVVAALARDNLLGRVVLVVGVDVPALDAGHDAAGRGVVPLALEARVPQEVLAGGAVLDAPGGLEGEVGEAEGVNGKAVAEDEHALVGRHGVAVGVVQAVGVVERAAVRGVADPLAGDEHAGAVLKAKARRDDVAHEPRADGAQGVRPQLLPVARDARADLDRVAVRAGGEAGRLEGAARAVRVGRGAGDVLHGEGGAGRLKCDISAHVAAAQDELAGVVAARRDIRHHDGGRLTAADLDESRHHFETRCCRHLDVLFQAGAFDNDFRRSTCSRDFHYIRKSSVCSEQRRALRIDEANGDGGAIGCRCEGTSTGRACSRQCGKQTELKESSLHKLNKF